MTFLRFNQILLRKSCDRCFPFIVDMGIAAALGNQAVLRMHNAQDTLDHGATQLACTRSSHISMQVDRFVRHYMDATMPDHIFIDLGLLDPIKSLDEAIAEAELDGKSFYVIETVQYHRRFNGYIFAIYIDKVVKWLTAKIGRNYSTWPPIANFARTVRNAIIHGGVIELSAAAPVVTWKGLQLSYADDGQNIFGPSYIYDGDLVMLMYELEAELIANDAPFDF